MRAMASVAGTQEEVVEAEQRVSALELFFDLVFVFAITQLTSFLYRDPTWARLSEALAVLMVLWFGWSGYMWLGNTAGRVGGPRLSTVRIASATRRGPKPAQPHVDAGRP
jgi:low temperature requirement protein LtrA